MTTYGTIVLVVYSLALSALAAVATESPPPADEAAASEPTKAVRALAPNWLIQPEDLSEKPAAGLAKRYANRAIGADEKVTASDVAAVPALPADVLLIGLPVARKLVAGGHVNAGRTVRICSGPVMLPLQPAVEALICPEAAAAHCTALVRAQPALLAANDLLLRAAASTCAQQGAENRDSAPPNG